MAVNNLKKNISPAKLDHTPTDMDLMQIMMSKIKTTETRCAYLEKGTYIFFQKLLKFNY